MCLAFATCFYRSCCSFFLFVFLRPYSEFSLLKVQTCLFRRSTATSSTSFCQWLPIDPTQEAKAGIRLGLWKRPLVGRSGNTVSMSSSGDGLRYQDQASLRALHRGCSQFWWCWCWCYEKYRWWFVRNPARKPPFGCIKPYEYWDIYYINWLAGFLPSTLLRCPAIDLDSDKLLNC